MLCINALIPHIVSNFSIVLCNILYCIFMHFLRAQILNLLYTSAPFSYAKRLISYQLPSHQLPSKPSSQSLRLPGPADRKSQRTSRLSKRHSHDDMLLLPQLGMPSSPCGLLDDSLNPATDTLASHRQKRVPKVNSEGRME